MALVAAAGSASALILAAGPTGPTGPPHASRASLPVLASVPGAPIGTVDGRFRDAQAGFSLSYPPRWTRLSSTDPQVRLLVRSPRGAVALLVRATPLSLSVSRVSLRTLPALRPLTDRLIAADRRAVLLDPPAKVQIAGVPGYAYVYTLPAARPGATVAHIHYFLFSGQSMIALVFQIADSRQLRALAPSLARIAATFRAAR